MDAESKEILLFIRDEICELRKDMEVLKADVAELKQDVATLKVDRDEMKNDIMELKQGINQLKEQEERHFIMLERDLGGALDGLNILNRRKVEKKQLKEAIMQL